MGRIKSTPGRPERDREVVTKTYRISPEAAAAVDELAERELVAKDLAASMLIERGAREMGLRSADRGVAWKD